MDIIPLYKLPNAEKSQLSKGKEDYVALAIKARWYQDQQRAKGVEIDLIEAVRHIVKEAGY